MNEFRIDPRIAFILSENEAFRLQGIVPVQPEWLGLTSEEVTAANVPVKVAINEMLIARTRKYMTWKHLDLRFITPSFDNNFSTYDVIAAILPSYQYLDQAGLDFLCLKDEGSIPLGMMLKNLGNQSLMRNLLEFDFDAQRLAIAFKAKLLQEAKQSKGMLTGAFVLKRPNVQLLNEAIIYEELRVIAGPKGLFVSVIFERDEHKMYVPFFWSPEGVNTSCLWGSHQITFAFDVMLAGIWRDLHVVKEKTLSQESFGTGARSKTAASKQGDKNIVTIPRRVYRKEWVRTQPPTASSGPRSAHLVTASYPYVGDHFPDEAAIARANEWGWPEPPEGHTFRVPHKRGEGDVDESAKKLRWRGHDVVNMVMSLRK